MERGGRISDLLWLSSHSLRCTITAGISQRKKIVDLVLGLEWVLPEHKTGMVH
jgi:hypothetical protein